MIQETKKIKVKRVTAADPELTVTLDATDGGTFPRFVRVDAAVSNTVDGGHYQGSGKTGTDGAQTEVVVVVSFIDPNYSTEIILNYSLTIYFSNDNSNWTQVPSGEVTDATGSTPATHGGSDADVLVAAEAEAPVKAESGAGSAQNKGCLGILFGILPF